MEELREIVECVLKDADLPPQTQEQENLRRQILGELFKVHSSTDTEALKNYVRWTQGIPIDKLAIGVAALLRSHQWPRLPLPAEVWEAARCAAGMNREQYRAGHYLRPQRVWPPFGKRHAINIDAGPFEPVKVALLEMPPTITPTLLAALNEDRGGEGGKSATDQE
jgi:hypothetical protein